MDTIYYGGPILTMESEIDSPEAVLVSKGIIKKVGTLKETMDAQAVMSESTTWMADV